jgi:uncharacterized protein YcfL
MKRIFVTLFLVVAFALAGCAGPQPVKQYELGKVTAETILYDARIMQNQGKITAQQFDQIRRVYDQLKLAQDAAIDARKAMIAYDTADSKAKVQAAMDGVLRLSTQMITLAQDIGLMKGGQ